VYAERGVVNPSFLLAKKAKKGKKVLKND